MATKLKLSKRHKLESLPNQALNELYIRQYFRISGFKFFNIDIVRHILALEFNTVEVGKAGQTEAEERDDA